MIFRLTCILAGILGCFVSWAQQVDNKSDHLKHEKSGQSYPGLMLSADYASNTNILGNFSSFKKQPSYSTSLSYFSKWGLDVSFFNYAVDNSDDSLDHFTMETDLIMGYGFEPVKNLMIYGNYSHYFYSSNSNSMKSIFSDDYHLDIDYTYKNTDLGITAGYLTGQEHTFYAALHNYYILNFRNVLFHNGHLSIQPGIDANFGDYEYLNMYYLDRLNDNRNFSGFLILNPVIRRYVRSQKLKYPGQTREQILNRFLREKARDTFKFTSAAINLPLSYSLGNFSLNLGFYVFIPVNQPNYLKNDVQFLFDMGVSYQLIFE